MLFFLSYVCTNIKLDTSCKDRFLDTVMGVRHEVFLPRTQRYISSSGSEPRVDNLAVANLRSYPLSCTVASWDNDVKVSLSSTLKRFIPSVGIEKATLLLLFKALKV